MTDYTWEPASTTAHVALTEGVIKGTLVPVCIGGDLETREWRVVWEGQLYRATAPWGHDATWTQAEIGTPVPHPLADKKIEEIASWWQESERFRRELQTEGGRHLHICRVTDKLQEVLEHMPIELRRKHELKNMITLLARMMMVENTPRTLSPSKLDRF